MTKHTYTYNVTITHDPCTTTTSEQRALTLFSIEGMNTMYEATVGDHCAKMKVD